MKVVKFQVLFVMLLVLTSLLSHGEGSSSLTIDGIGIGCERRVADQLRAALGFLPVQGSDWVMYCQGGVVVNSWCSPTVWFDESGLARRVVGYPLKFGGQDLTRGDGLSKVIEVLGQPSSTINKESPEDPITYLYYSQLGIGIKLATNTSEVRYFKLERGPMATDEF